MSDVTVVIVTFQSENEIKTCLDSLPAQLDVLVLDNASTDASAELAREHGVRVIENQKNVGFARAVNQAFENTSSPYVLLLNPDARIAKDTVVELLAAMAPDVAVAAANLVRSDGQPQRSSWPFPSSRAMWAEAFGLHRRSGRRRSASRSIESVVGACMMISRVAFDSVGGFDERFWLYGEETDFCRRTRQIGYRSVVLEHAVVEHIGGASSDGLGSTARRHFLYGSERHVLLHEGRLALASFRLAVLTGALLRLPALSVLGGDRLVMRAATVRQTGWWMVRHPFTVPTEKMESVDEIIVLSLEPWDEIWRRNQFLVKELLTQTGRPTRVLFVEPPLDVLHELRGGHRVRRRPKLPELVAGHPGLYTFQPTKFLPRSLGPHADRALVKQVVQAAENVGFTRPTLWINDSAFAPIVKQSGWPALYDITDDWTREAVSPRELHRRLQREEELLTRSAEVVVCSPDLQTDRGSRRPVRLIPNAVDVDHFRRSQDRPKDLPDGPVATYVGTLHRERVDVELIIRLATAHPEIQIVLIGPSLFDAGETASLNARPNIHLLGARPYALVPGYLQHSNVVIVPHVVSPFTESLDPIKLYECMALGLPTVATPVAGFRGAGAPIVTAVGAAFVDAVAAAVATGVSVVRDDVPSWKSRATEFRFALDSAAEKAPTRIKVVFLGHTAKLSGAELALTRMLQGLPAVDALVLLGEDGPLVQRLLDETDARVEVMPLNARARDVNRSEVNGRRLPIRSVLATTMYSLRLAKRLRSLAPDLVHTNTLKASMYGAVAGRLARIPVVWHVRDRIADDYMPAPAVRLVRILIKLLPTAVVANSATTMRTLGGKAERHSAVGPRVIHDSLPPADLPLEPHDGFVVCMCGRLAPWKGQDVFIRAFAQADLGEDTSALIVGSAMFGEEGYERELIALAEELGVEKRVHFLGFVRDVWSVLVGIDVLVHASILAEPFGQVVLEGMAVGLPVIASSEGGPAEIITHGVNGLLVPPGDPVVLTRALEELHRNAGLRRRLSQAAVARSLDFTPEIIGASLMALYAETLAKRNGRT